MYNSGQGRWLSPDPIGGDISNPQSLNRYAYVLNNPTNLIDPLGLQSGAFTMIICAPPEYQVSGPPGDQTVNSIRPGSCTTFFFGGGGGSGGWRHLPHPALASITP